MDIIRRFTAVAIILIILIGFLAYGNTLRNGFVYDDTLVVVDNNFISSWKNLPHLFNINYFLGSGELSYRPIVTLTYFLDYSFWGPKPFGYHLTNLIFHLLCGVLLYFFLNMLLPVIDKGFFVKEERKGFFPLLSLLAVLFFISSPIQTESVDCVAFRPEVMYAFFILLCLICYFKASISETFAPKKLYIISLSSYFFALLAKEGALVVLFLVLLLDTFLFIAMQPGKLRLTFIRKRFFPYIGFFLVSLIYALIRFVWMTSPATGHQMTSGEAIFSADFFSRLVTIPYVLVNYIKLLFLPLRLTSEYVLSFSRSFFDLRVFSSAIILLGVVILIFYNLRRRRIFSFCGFWFLLGLAPAVNLIPLHHPIAERYLYLPSIGFFLFLSAGIIKLAGGIIKSNLKARYLIIAAIGLLIISAYTIKSNQQNKAWYNEESFWKMVMSYPGGHTARAHVNYGIVFMEQERYDAALNEFQNALMVSPNYIQAYNNIALVYYKLGEFDKAIENFRKIVDFNAAMSDFDFIKVYSNLGVAYLAKNEPDKAIEYYKMALELNPYLAEVHFNLGNAYLAKNMKDAAIESFQNGLKINPDMVRPYYNLGVLMFEKKSLDEAKQYFQKAISVANNFAPAYYGLSLVYEEEGNHNLAKEYLEKSQKLGFNPQGSISTGLTRREERR